MSGEENEVVPRILLKGIPNHLNLLDIYIGLCKFGTITYIGLGKEVAVVEFADRISLGKVLARQPLKMKGKSISISHEPEWQKIRGLVKKHENFALGEDVKPILSSEELFNEKVYHLISTADQMSIPFDDNPEDQNNPTSRHPVCSVLEKTLSKEMCSDIRVYPFGSRVTGTSLETSDLDIFVDCENRFNCGSYDANEQADLVVRAKRILTKSWPDFNHVLPVPRARVPIVKFLHCPSNTRCDASFNNGLGCRTARLVKFILSLDDRIRPLILLLKYWAYYIDMQADNKNTNRPELTSHALIMLTFTYLQTTKPPILPPIKKMRESANYSLVVGGWETAFRDDVKQFQITATNDKRTIRDLFLDFIKQFQCVDWTRLAASPLEGSYVQRNTVPQNIPTRNLPMVVLDPFNLSRNLTANVCDLTLLRVLATCALTEKEMAVE